MNINLRKITGNWDEGYALDKHTLSSTYVGDNPYGHWPAAGFKDTELGVNMKPEVDHGAKEFYARF